MHLGLIHTHASLADLRAALTAMRANYVKVVPAWWPHPPQALAALPQRKAIRTSWGDPSYANGARAYPLTGPTLDELRPYLDAMPDAAVELGNEPSGHGLDVGRYAADLAETVSALRRAYPRATILPPAHSPHAADRVAWLTTLAPIARQCDAATIHGYSDAEVRSELSLIRRHVSGSLPVWLTEVNYGMAMPDVHRARALAALLRDLPGVPVALLYHLDTHDSAPLEQQGGAHYRLSLATLQALGQEPEPMKSDTPLATWAGMTRAHFTPGRARNITAVVMHATAGKNSYEWLRQGGHLTDPKQRVSCHYLISKTGEVWQFVREGDTAWHAGPSKWRGLEYAGSLNACSIGIELENLNNGKDPYPKAQIDAAIVLTRDIVQRRNIRLEYLVRHLDISPGRKNDPVAFPWSAFVADVYLSDPWAEWGTAYPLPIEQRGWLVPQTWLGNRAKLGKAVARETYITPDISHCLFERGMIVYHKPSNQCHIVVF